MKIRFSVSFLLKGLVTEASPEREYMQRLPIHTKKRVEAQAVVDIEAAKKDLRRIVFLTISYPPTEIHELASHAYTMLIGTENKPDKEED
jgi:hypothetical protein